MYANIKDLFENLPSDSQDLNAYQLANFLNIFGAILIKGLREQKNGSFFDSYYDFKESELEFIESIFKELSDNFFPMAHSQKPLRDLEINEKKDIADLKGLVEVAQCRMKDVNEIFENLRSCIQNLDR